MKIDARLDFYSTQGPDPWNDDWGSLLPLSHIICRDMDGIPHTVGEYIWPWTAYLKDHKKFVLHFYYWNQKIGPKELDKLDVNPERKARIREMQFLMTRLIYFGNENAPRTLHGKLYTLHHLARFAEARSYSIRDVLTKTSLLDAFGASIPDFTVKEWMRWIKFLRQLDPATQLGFTLATPKEWADLENRYTERRNRSRQHAPLPTRIYGELINNLSTELNDHEVYAPRLEAALRDALVQHAKTKVTQRGHFTNIGPALIEKHGLKDYLIRHGFSVRNKTLNSLSGAVSGIFRICKLQIHVFSGMRHDEARTLPYHCMVTKKSLHGRTHSLIAGITTKLNNGRCLRTHWVTTNDEGFRAIRLAQRFAHIIYESLGIPPSKDKSHNDKLLLFPATGYLPWEGRHEIAPNVKIQTSKLRQEEDKESVLARLLPVIEEEDIAELETIDPFRVWRDEPAFAIGQRWPLTTHQLRRSLAVYANASGLVRLTSLRRQLQHITREMTFYYGRGSTFCQNFITDDPDGYMRHIATEWQNGEEESKILAFTCDVLNSNEPMFGGAGNFYQRQKERGDVMTCKDVEKRMKAGLLSYAPGPLGGCTKTGGCDKRKGLDMIDISCATDDCKNLVGKHSKIIRVIHLKRTAMAHITPGSIEALFEKEELDALELVERKWRSQTSHSVNPTGGRDD